MIDIIPAREDMASLLTPQAAQLATGQMLTKAAMAAAIAGGLSLAAVSGSRVLAIGGISEVWDGRGVIWGLLGEDIDRDMIPIHRAVTRTLALSTLPRIEAHVACSHETGHRWMKLLGFQREGTMRAFWQGHDYDLYARVR